MTCLIDDFNKRIKLKNYSIREYFPSGEQMGRLSKESKKCLHRLECCNEVWEWFVDQWLWWILRLHGTIVNIPIVSSTLSLKFDWWPRARQFYSCKIAIWWETCWSCRSHLKDWGYWECAHPYSQLSHCWRRWAENQFIAIPKNRLIRLKTKSCGHHWRWPADCWSYRRLNGPWELVKSFGWSSFPKPIWAQVQNQSQVCQEARQESN